MKGKKKMTTTDTRSMETRSIGTSSSGMRQRGLARRLPWQVILGRWLGTRCRGGGLDG